MEAVAGGGWFLYQVHVHEFVQQVSRFGQRDAAEGGGLVAVE